MVITNEEWTKNMFDAGLKQQRSEEVKKIYSNPEFDLFRHKVLAYWEDTPDISKNDLISILFSEWKSKNIPTDWLPYIMDEVYCLDDRSQDRLDNWDRMKREYNRSLTSGRK